MTVKSLAPAAIKTLRAIAQAGGKELRGLPQGADFRCIEKLIREGYLTRGRDANGYGMTSMTDKGYAAIA